MTFLWSDVLWLLLGVPALIALYVLLLRRRKRVAVRYTNLDLVREAMGPWQRFRRHVPPLVENRPIGRHGDCRLGRFLHGTESSSARLGCQGGQRVL